MAVGTHLLGRSVGDSVAPPLRGFVPYMGVSHRTLGELLRHYRKRKYSNLLTLAEELNTSKDVLSNYENDKSVPGHKMLLELIEKLEIPPVPLLMAIGYPIEPPKSADVQDAAVIAIRQLPISDERKDALIQVLRDAAHAQDLEQPPESPPKPVRPPRPARSSA